MDARVEPAHDDWEATQPGITCAKKSLNSSISTRSGHQVRRIPAKADGELTVSATRRIDRISPVARSIQRGEGRKLLPRQELAQKRNRKRSCSCPKYYLHSALTLAEFRWNLSYGGWPLRAS
jgi:hypothetical protein